MIALFVALGGTVYAAKKIDGKTIRAKSLPGNRLKPRSVPANRLKPNVLKQARVSAPLTGADINELTLGRVPSATHAESADRAQSAVDAETALNAINAVDARTVNGFEAGCGPGTVLFAGACWDASATPKDTAPDAAANCAARGGALPDALALAAFADQPSINLDSGDEWSGDIPVVSGPDVYAVVTVASDGEIDFAPFGNERSYRCVIPLLS